MDYVFLLAHHTQAMYKAIVNENDAVEVQLDDQGNGSVDGNLFQFDILEAGPNAMHVLVDHKRYAVEIIELDLITKSTLLRVNNRDYHVKLTDQYDELLAKMGMERGAATQEVSVKAPMPGMVLNVLVEPGTELEKDQPILILEAMKMENVIKSPRAGQIATIHAVQGNAVEKNEVLVEFTK